MSLKKASIERIDTDEYFRFLNTTDSLTLVLRGHIGLEVVLNHILNRSLNGGLTHDLSRIGFIQKVDLAIGLGKLDPEFRALFVKVTEVRNRYAHNLKAEITKEDAREALALLPRAAMRPSTALDAIETHPLGPSSAIGWCMAILWSRAMNRGMFDHPPELPA